MFDLKIGDKLMVRTFESWSRRKDVIVTEVKKINKATYTLANSTLVYKENLAIRGDNWVKYELYDEGIVADIKAKAFDFDVEVYVNRLEKNYLTDIKKLKLAIERLEKKARKGE